MKNKTPRLCYALVLVALLPAINCRLSICRAQGTAFAYQGQLSSAGTPATGSYDLQFTLFATNQNGSAIAGPVTNSAVGVTNGLFTTLVNFGNAFTGASNWLQMAVSTNGANAFATLTPRQQLTPVPYAIMALNASNLLGTLSASKLSGAYSNSVAMTNGANQYWGTYKGNGANVTNVNAVTLNGLNSTNLWQSGGNNVAAGQFIGSTNSQPVELRTGNTRALRLEPTVNDTNHASLVNVVGGSPFNYVTPGVYGAVIAGGGASNYFGLTGILASNRIGSDLSFVGGGSGNYIASSNSAYSFVGGGSGNFIASNSAYSFVGGGNQNSIQTNAAGAVLGGGFNNTNGGAYAVVPGGLGNYADGVYSFAAGQQAQALHQGAFVWADSQNTNFSSTTNDQFLVRAQGGVGINTNNPAGAALNVNGKLTSPLWKTSVLLDLSGSLSMTTNFTCSGGTLMIFASGSGYATAVGTIGMNIQLDGVTIDSCYIFANQTLNHLAFVPKMIVKTGVAPGTHTIALQPRTGTTTDYTDNYNLVIQELPY